MSLYQLYKEIYRKMRDAGYRHEVATAIAELEVYGRIKDLEEKLFGIA